ncbi:MAG: hypothetical protein JST69_11095 [Bacteroidetes bacterium]|nr:hypothetical protein [Bacteroidota bacterium]
MAVIVFSLAQKNTGKLMTMNKNIYIAVATLLALSSQSVAQKKGAIQEKTDASRFRWEQSKIVPKLKKLAITELTVNYKLTTTAKTIAQEKSSGKIAGARVTAYLEFTDGEPSQDDFQGITDHFYSYFQKKLKANGIDTVGWSTVTDSEFYQKNGDDNEKDDSKKKGSGNEWIECTANKGKIVHRGAAGFAGGKGKRAEQFAKEFGTAVSLKVNVDFADVVVNMAIKTRERINLYDGWYYPEVTTQKYTWGVHAQMRVGDQDNKNWTYIWGTKGWPEFLFQWSDIPVEGNYATSMTEDVSKARSGLAKQWAFRKELTPMLIQTTKDKYKSAAIHAVEKWVDAFVERAVQMRND